MSCGFNLVILRLSIGCLKVVCYLLVLFLLFSFGCVVVNLMLCFVKLIWLLVILCGG